MSKQTFGNLAFALLLVAGAGASSQTASSPGSGSSARASTQSATRPSSDNACLENLRKLGLGLTFHALRGGERPVLAAKLADLAEISPMEGRSFFCPLATAAGPLPTTRPLPSQVSKEWIVAKQSYLYLGAGLPMTAWKQREIILVLDPPNHPHPDGQIGVLFADMHVEEVPLTRLPEALRRSAELREKIKCSPQPQVPGLPSTSQPSR
jgi:hypothetical protein